MKSKYTASIITSFAYMRLPRKTIAVFLFLGTHIFLGATAYAVTSAITITANGGAGSITVPYGTNIKLTWTGVNVSACVASQTPTGTWTGAVAITGTQTILHQYDTTIYTITCKSSTGSSIKSTVNVISLALEDPIDPVSITFTADDDEGSTTIDYGASTTLAWTSDNTIFCSEIYTGTTTDYSKLLTSRVEGVLQTKELTSSQTFFINCEHLRGHVVSSSIQVNVDSRPLPTVALTVDDNEASTTIPYGSTTTLSWDSTETEENSCVLKTSVAGTTSMPINLTYDISRISPSGEYTSENLFASKVFTVVCSNESGMASSSVFVNVEPPEPKQNFFEKTMNDLSNNLSQKLLPQKTCASSTSNIRYGSRDKDTNNEVSRLQKFLKSQGVYAGEPTGYAGKGTIIAVQKFQKKMNLQQTGLVGPLTRSKINSSICLSSTNQG